MLFFIARFKDLVSIPTLVQLIANKRLEQALSATYLNSTLVQLIVVINLNKIDKESNSYTLSIDHFLRYFSVDL